MVDLASLGRFVSHEGGSYNAASKEELNSCVQASNIHHGKRLNTTSRSSGGMMAGMGDACGLREKKRERLLRDNASAEVFCTPGR